MSKYYKWTLKRKRYIKVPSLKGIRLMNEWVKIRGNGYIYISAGYSWDGCSVKFLLDGKVFGTWDGPLMSNGVHQQCYKASLVHDALYQFMPELEAQGYTRKQADEEFLRIMKNDGFKLAYLYYGTVRLFGGIFTKIKNI